ncbi:MAG: DUF2723 domain-containing protein [Cyclobacteriaceae bacterium]
MEELMTSFPQRLAFRLLKWVCPANLLETIEGDLIEQYEDDVNEFGKRKAKGRLAWNAIKFFRLGIIQMHELKFMGWTKNINNANGHLNFNWASKLTGWAVFTITLTVYFLTVEETASFWDCSEFIASAYKLEVPHPPGAPLFLLIGRLFSFFSFGDTTKVAYALNMMSVLASSFTIMFLFWSIVLLGRKLLGASQTLLSEEKKWLLLASGIVGSLTYAFSDSFWYSAVEAEVYAMSSLSTALVVWCILKWDTIEDESEGNRWLILIAYIVGLSIGIHLLSLLTLPVLALIYYLKKFKPTALGVVSALVVGGAGVIVISNLVVQGLPTLAGYFELFFVNTLGLFFGSGAIVFMIILISLLILGISITQKKNYPVLNTFLLAFTFILIGYGSYSTIIIRSNFNPPINENAPKDVMSVVSYLKREQYGSWPLLYGPYYTANPIGVKTITSKYVKGKDKYERGESRYNYEYEPEDQTIFPRVWNPQFKNDYQSIIDLKHNQRPNFSQNINYFLKHQVGTMYMRYFMWNFAGRESDEDGAGWLKPTSWFKDMPVALAANHARNNYWMVPFILGFIGMLYQLRKDTKSFYVLALLFLSLGIAIVIYLNSPPTEPRERDYIYAGSFYAFAFWIGIALFAVVEALKKFSLNSKILTLTISLLVVFVPALMLKEGWDDHDRSNRFFSVDSATNTLSSCDKNGILFTGGDNDTFPMWYAQEAEGYRTDLRVLVLSYCNTDWYIDQMTRQVNQSNPFSFTLGAAAYKQGGPNDYLTFADLNIDSIDAKQYLELLAKNHPRLRAGDRNIFPSKTITIDIDKNAIRKMGIVPREMEGLIVNQMKLKILDNVIEKRDLVFLDLLLTNNWERPIYLNPTSMAQMNFDLRPYAMLEGNVFRILPIKNNRSDREYLVNTKKSFDLMVDKFKYRGLDDSTIYYTNDYAMQVWNHRTNLNSLAEALIDKGETDKASQVLSFSLSKMSDAAVPYDPSSPDTVNLLFKAGLKQKAIEVAKVVADRANEIASFLISDGNISSYQLRKNIYLLGAMQRSLLENGEEKLAIKYDEEYNGLIDRLGKYALD